MVEIARADLDAEISLSIMRDKVTSQLFSIGIDTARKHHGKQVA